MSSRSNQRTIIRGRATYLTLISTFWALFPALLPRCGERCPVDLGPLDLTKLGFPIFHLGRLASEDRVNQPLREPFTWIGRMSRGAAGRYQALAIRLSAPDVLPAR